MEPEIINPSCYYCKGPFVAWCYRYYARAREVYTWARSCKPCASEHGQIHIGYGVYTLDAPLDEPMSR